MSMTGIRQGLAPVALLAAVLTGTGPAAGQEAGQAPLRETGQSAYPLFADDAPLDLKLTGPFKTVADDDDEREEYPAVIEFRRPDGSTAALDVQIRLRGKSRAEYCDFPPLSLDFDFPDGSATEGTVFAGQNRLKLVVQCRPTSRYTAYLVKEFLIYRMWNALTDRSLRVRWANLEYVYTDTRRPESRMEPAFFIEEDWEAAERLGMEVVETDTLDRASLDPPYTTLLVLFQYLIANTDWAVLDGPEGESCCHNGKVVRNGDGLNFVLPYDFDSTGLVNAEYAAPSVRQIRTVTQRQYRGFCGMNGELDGAIARLDSQHDRLIGILDDERLEARERTSAIRFLEDGFESLNDPRDRERRIERDCR
jgi:hypothetical protein